MLICKHVRKTLHLTSWEKHSHQTVGQKGCVWGVADLNSHATGRGDGADGSSDCLPASVPAHQSRRRARGLAAEPRPGSAPSPSGFVSSSGPLRGLRHNVRLLDVGGWGGRAPHGAGRRAHPGPSLLGP